MCFDLSCVVFVLCFLIVLFVCFLILHVLLSVSCFIFCIVSCSDSPLPYSCLFSICVQFYRPLPPGGKPIAVNIIT